MHPNLIVVDHPLVQHKLTLMRRKDTSTAQFRALLSEIALLLGYEAMRNLKLTEEIIETPLMEMKAARLEGKKLVLIAIMRAGQGIVDGLLQLVPSARVGHVGLYRDPKTLQAVEYYYKVPQQLEDRDVLVCDPMLATGGSATAAITFLKEYGCKHIKLMSIIGAPEGIKKVQEEHPDVDIFVAAEDEKLNEHGYIVPGLGDAGDRIFGTK